MKKVLLFILFGWLALEAGAQEGTRFLDNEPWEKVVKKAEKTGKLIFVDCYTSWCGPCKQLATEIFPQKKVGDYMNEKFICVKYDMEKEEGLELDKRYPGEVKSYPTMLIISPQKEEILHKVVGSQPADELLAAIESGLQGNTIYALEKEYRQGRKDDGFIKTYLTALDNANEKERYEQVARAYMAQFPMDSLLNPEIWEMAERFVVEEPYSPEYRFVVEHLDDFQKRGVERYALEKRLSESIGFEVNMLFLSALQPDSRDSLPSLLKKAGELFPLLKHPVKGFPETLAELSVNECLLKNDVDAVYDRFIVLTDCGLINRNTYQGAVFRYLFNNLTDKERLQICMEHVQELQKQFSGWERDLMEEVIVLGKEKIENIK